MRQKLSHGALGMILAAALGVGCASATALGSASDSSAKPGGGELDKCNADAQCVRVRGNPCNPCGACPGEAETTMTQARLDQYLRDTEYCPSRRLMVPPGSPPAPPPACSPCAASQTQIEKAIACEHSACIFH